MRQPHNTWARGLRGYQTSFRARRILPAQHRHIRAGPQKFYFHLLCASTIPWHTNVVFIKRKIYVRRGVSSIRPDILCGWSSWVIIRNNGGYKWGYVRETFVRLTSPTSDTRWYHVWIEWNRPSRTKDESSLAFQFNSLSIAICGRSQIKPKYTVMSGHVQKMYLKYRRTTIDLSFRKCFCLDNQTHFILILNIFVFSICV